MEDQNLESKIEGIVRDIIKKKKSSESISKIKNYGLDSETIKKRYTEDKIEILERLSKLFIEGDVYSRDELISKINDWDSNYNKDLRNSKNYDYSSYIRGLVDLGLLKRNKNDSLFEGYAKKISYKTYKPLEKSVQKDYPIIVKKIIGSPYNKHKTKILKELSSGFVQGVVYSRDDAIDLVKKLANEYDSNLLKKNGFDYEHLLRGLIDIGHLNQNRNGTKYCKGTPNGE
ncbi:hypothetical protein ISS04_02485 [Candidatus Woesearchaeota archaeon]|nr:hypothetical protein [Candidatus Woesearchaeota archaeon]